MGTVEAQEVIIFEELMDSQPLFFTGNTSTLYVGPTLDLKRGGPTVVKVPDGLLGPANDAWFRYANDLMKGGRYLYLPPGYEGDVPDGYTVLRPRTYRLWLLMCPSIADGVDKAAKLVKNSLRVYPLLKAGNPPEMKFINVSGKPFNTIHANTFHFLRGNQRPNLGRKHGNAGS